MNVSALHQRLKASLRVGDTSAKNSTTPVRCALNRHRYVSGLRSVASFQNNVSRTFSTRQTHRVYRGGVSSATRLPVVRCAQDNQLLGEEIVKKRAEEQAKRVSLLVSEWDVLKFSNGNSNFATFIWREIAAIPREYMYFLLDFLGSDCIYKLWTLS
eukprot:CAMPEP_0198215180 /NCGR_PEP_ID=MMETSP1445-20131203/47705_1 /TAXON_ID=36898 /ORGANISM="Pyramimonas sp., Strain CCMP2087" /LENGTH=156 /DNA_ID=CAMNT_0043890777 /DNA_START=72 /DNA_END=539 /DNA_ORIENTATION=+